MNCVARPQSGETASLAGTGLYARNQSVLWTELDGQFVLMDIESGAYFELTGVGSVIWRVLETSRSETDLVNHIIGSYDVGQAECERDVRAFLDKLLAARMVQQEAGAADQSSSALPVG